MALPIDGLALTIALAGRGLATTLRSLPLTPGLTAAFFRAAFLSTGLDLATGFPPDFAFARPADFDPADLAGADLAGTDLVALALAVVGLATSGLIAADFAAALGGVFATGFALAAGSGLAGVGLTALLDRLRGGPGRL